MSKPAVLQGRVPPAPGRDGQGADTPTSPDTTDNFDLLSQLLNSLRVDSSAVFVFEFSNPWGVELEFRQPFSWTVSSGSVWLVAPGQAPLRVDKGDTFIFPRGTSTPCKLLSALDAQAFPAHDLWMQAKLPSFRPGKLMTRPRRLQWGGGGDRLTRVVSLAFGFHDRRLGPLVDALPEVMVVRAAHSESGFLDALLTFPFASDGEPQPGFAAVANQTAQLLLIHLVRIYATQQVSGSMGWLAGLADPKLARALACIHQEPSKRWTVALLAAAAGMSRSVFAERFLACVGQPPLHYLCTWRMHLAREALMSGRTVTELTHELGYQSEAAFRSAFRRLTGQSPRAFRQTASSSATGLP